MKFFFASLMFLILGVSTVTANDFSVTEQEKPYDVVLVQGSAEDRHTYLGELDKFPIMYEMSSDRPFNLSAVVSQRYRGSSEPLPFSIIMIRQNDQGGGVTEVARLWPKSEDWTIEKNSVHGMTFWNTEVLQADVEPGTYRIEVSTASNQGKYRLTLGESDESSGYFKTLGEVRTTQKFFGYSFFKILTSSYVYYPLGILILLFGIHRTWLYRKSISHDT